MLSALGATAATWRPHMLFSAKMDGSQETPAVSGSGSGVATVLWNNTRDTMCINVTFAGLSGAASSAHIHSGAVGVAGPVVIDLSSYITGNRIVATITGTALTTAVKSAMLKGMTYINVHTAANPGGEIRGQIGLESDMAFVGALDGAQSTPSISTTANGYAVFNVAKHQGTVNFYVITNGLSGAITSSHLHSGAVGVSGPVIQDLSTYISGNTLTGSFTPSAGVISSMMAGNVYINIHTAANPGGEIRAQLRMDDKIAFDAWMTGAQETPSVSTSAKGLTSLRLNTTMDTLWYNVYTTGLSGAITSAHLHTGAIGVAGPPVITYTGTSGNMISGYATGALLTSAFINSMLTGGVYSNVHTVANAGGEIRGQVYRVMREGYTLSMDAMQETPATSSTAKGSGMVSISRYNDNAHYMIAINGVPSSTGMHFHKGAVGTAGGVIDDISAGYSNNGNSGYWKSTDATPFTMTSVNTIDADSAYINIHTSANPGGEIRGQIFYGFKCYSVATGIESLDGITESGVSLYPNPSRGSFNVAFGSAQNEQATVTVTDVTGKIVSSINYNVQIGQNTFSVDMKSSAAGMYFVKIGNGKQEVTRKLILQ